MISLVTMGQSSVSLSLDALAWLRWTLDCHRLQKRARVSAFEAYRGSPPPKQPFRARALDSLKARIDVK